MSQQPQQSLRKHRQTLVPGAVSAAQKKSYGQLGAVSGQLPAVASKDREKVGNMVKRRFSSRVQGDNIYGLTEEIPPLPMDASDMISASSRKQSSGEASLHGSIKSKPGYPFAPRQQAPERMPPVSTEDSEDMPERISNAADTANPYQKYPSVLTGPALRDPDEPPLPVEKSPEMRTTRANKQNYSDKRPAAVQTTGDVFLDKNFDAKAYISAQLSSATEKEISAFADDLVNRQEVLKHDRKEALHKNYKTFLKVGSEITGFGAEMDTLRRLVNDLKEATNAMIDDAELILVNNSNSDLVPGTRRDSASQEVIRSNSRSSVIMLEKMWATELASLFRHVESAQQYLPVVPGRHVVKESGGWYQLNAATWKPLQPIHIFLLNDHILLATKKRNKNRSSSDPKVQSTKLLIAENCWPLQDVELIDISKDNSLDPSIAQYTKNAICIRAGSATCVYRADKSDSHRRIIAEFTRTRAELMKLRSFGRTHSRQGSGAGSISNGSTGSRSVSASGEGAETVNDVQTTLQDLKEIDNAISELDITIAYRKFDEAVDLIDSHMRSIQKEGKYRLKGRSITGDIVVASEILKGKLDQRVNELGDLLLAELSQDYLSRSQIQQTVQLLIRLYVEEQAKKTYLESRRSQLGRRVKQVEFHGDIVNYIRQITLIFFRMIESTVQIFQACFTKIEDTSSVVQWAKEQVDAYGVLFARQLYNVAPTSPTYQKCAEITREQCLHLERLGLDFGFRLKFIYGSG